MVLPIQTFSADLLVGWAQTRTALATRTSQGGNGASAPTAKAPWDSGKPTPASQLVTNALAGRQIFDASSKTFSGAGVTPDARKLFALHAGLNTLSALIGRYDQASDAEKLRLERTFASATKQLDSYLSTLRLDGLSLVRAASANQVTSNAVVKDVGTAYETRTIHTGSATTAAAEFEGPFTFGIDALNKDGDPVHIDVDLADMGAQPRSLTNVVHFINSKLGAAGLETRFEMVLKSKPGQDEQWALKIDGKGVESFSFTAGNTASALYIAGSGNNLLKLQDPASTGLNAPPLDPAGVKNAVYDQTHDGGKVRASAVGPDGSYYVIADLTQDAKGLPIKGASDVALSKYDSAGKLMYTRVLGAADSAQGFAISVAADGRVAVAGSVRGALTSAQTGQADADDAPITANGAAGDTQTDSFVTVYDADGVEAWTARRESKGNDQANAVAFGADGSVYVAGAAAGSLPGATSAGGTDSYLRTYSADGVERDVQQFGTAGEDSAQAIVVQTVGGVQQVTVGGLEGGKLVLRQFSDDGAAIAAGATRNLGALVNGKVSGLAADGGNIYVAGMTAADGLNAGTIARAYSGGTDGFVIKLADDLTAGAGDRISYIGGAGDDSIAGIAVQGGQVWLGGDSKASFGGALALGESDGYVARLDASGALDWTQRFTQKGGKYETTSFAFNAQGASALDRLGLPQGAIAEEDTDLITTQTALRAGDQFRISINGRTPQTVTIRANDTMQTLADRIEQMLLSDGKAFVQLATKGDGLTITASPGDRIDILAGPAGRDALAGLGINETSVAAAPSKTKAKKATKKTYGLGLDSALDITTSMGRKQATAQIGAALSAIQKAYRDLTTPAATPKGSVPEYLTARLKNYQAALARLQG